MVNAQYQVTQEQAVTAAINTIRYNGSRVFLMHNQNNYELCFESENLKKFYLTSPIPSAYLPIDS
mgnify:FL=1